MAELASTLDHQRRVFALLAEIVVLDPAQREQALAEVDAELAERVRALLEVDDPTEDWLDPSWHGEPAVKAASPLLPGQSIGPYRVLETIGVGGMGTVYLAEQKEPVARNVALKVLRLSLDNAEARRRFSSERHAMGRLDHPNVAKIFDAGVTGEGAPYLAMEWVDGEPITEYCDRERLSIEQRLRLFVQICRGVDHAHRSFLLHRDIKPSNVLVAEVDGAPAPKLIDFGIVKGLDGSLLSEAAAEDAALTGARLLGTPLYMSPEALGLGGDLDIRSDVFSLGVLLYELLAGYQPWGGTRDGLALLMHRRVKDEPAPPGTWLEGQPASELRELGAKRGAATPRWFHRLRGDLDAIMRKAMARGPEERYESAQSLAADIERFLAYRPIRARRPGRLYLLRKTMIRHRALVAFCAVLVLGVAGTLFGFFEARRLAREAVAAQAESEKVIQLMVGLFSDARPGEDAEGVSTRELLARGGELIETGLASDPRRRARLQALLGSIYSQWRLLDEAEPLLEAAVEAATSEGVRRAEAIGPMTNLAWLRYYQQRYDEALSLGEQALELAQRLAPEDRVQLSGIHAYLGQIEARRGELDAAEAHQQRALALYLGLTLDSPGSGKPGVLTQIHRGLARIDIRRRDYEAAAQHGEEALRVTVESYGEMHRRTASALSLLGITYYRLKRYGDAEKTLRRAMGVVASEYGENDVRLSDLLLTLGNVQKDSGRLEEAEASYRRGIALLEQHQPASRDLASLYNNLGHMLAVMSDRPSEGRALLLQSLALKEKLHGPESKRLTTTLAALGELELNIQNPVAAEVFARRILEIQEKAKNADPGQTGRAWYVLGQSLRRQDRPDEARQALQSALTIFRDLEFSKSVALVEAEIAAIDSEKSSGDGDQQARDESSVEGP